LSLTEHKIIIDSSRTNSQTNQMAKISLNLGGEHFESKSDAKRYIQKLYKELVGVKIDTTHPKFKFFIDLLNRHPRAHEKTNGVVPEFFIIKPVWNAVCCFINGNVDFSYQVCLTPSKNDQGRLEQAMRNAVKDQTQAFRSTLTLPIPCAICLEPITTDNDLQIDHEITFKDLKNAFLTNHTAPTEFNLSGPSSTFLPQDNAFEHRWYHFHKNNARLRPTHGKCNLSRNLTQT